MVRIPGVPPESGVDVLALSGTLGAESARVKHRAAVTASGALPTPWAHSKFTRVGCPGDGPTIDHQ